MVCWGDLVRTQLPLAAAAWPGAGPRPSLHLTDTARPSPPGPYPSETGRSPPLGLRDEERGDGGGGGEKERNSNRKTEKIVRKREKEREGKRKRDR